MLVGMGNETSANPRLLFATLHHEQYLTDGSDGTPRRLVPDDRWHLVRGLLDEGRVATYCHLRPLGAVPPRAMFDRVVSDLANVGAPSCLDCHRVAIAEHVIGLVEVLHAVAPTLPPAGNHLDPEACLRALRDRIDELLGEAAAEPSDEITSPETPTVKAAEVCVGCAKARYATDGSTCLLHGPKPVV